MFYYYNETGSNSRATSSENTVNASFQIGRNETNVSEFNRLRISLQ